MKYRYFVATVIGVIALFALTNWFYTIGKNNQDKKLVLSVASLKESYLPGETVTLTVTATNKDDEIIKMLDGLSPDHGYLTFLVSQDGKNYKKYNNPKWGRTDSKLFQVTLKPNEEVNTSVKILWNSKPEIDTSELAPETVKAATEGKILTDYAFPEPGIYQIKAVYHVFFIPNVQDKSVEIESEPTQITIKEAVGEDLEVWNKIKDDGEIAFLLQEGDLRNPFERTKKEGLKQKIEQLIIQHSNSVYADFLQRSLENLRVNESKRENSIYNINKH